MPRKILVVDDEPLIVKGLKFNLQQDGYEVDTANEGHEALRMISEGDYDLVLLDLMLPGMDGLSICQQVRGFSDVPIIMVTAKSDDMDKIMGLEYGADDYIAKPFNILEVKARVKSVMRRVRTGAPQAETSSITIGSILVNLDSRSVYLDGKPINLTAKEFDLLRLFVTNRGKVFSREQLLESVWKNGGMGGDLRTVDVHIRRLREKIERNPSQPEYIFTKWGVGYYFAEG